MKRDKITSGAVFKILEQCAVEGRRCPENSTHGVGNKFIPALARAGHIRIEISGHNYRQIHILTGPHAGKSTAPNPTGQKPWRILDAAGACTNGKLELPPSRGRQQPSSLPRF